jgi:histidine triad (HIT) family protein
MPDCLFCRIAAGELPAEVIATSERAIAFMDINPATRGHALVIPRAHATDVGDIGEEDLAACAALAARIAAVAREDLGAAGVNILNSSGPAAWQTVFHFHLHVIPRYEGDPLRLPWTPAPGDPAEIAAAGASYRRAASSVSGALPPSPPGVE